MRLTMSSVMISPAPPVELAGPGWAVAVPLLVLPALLLCPPDQRLLSVLAAAIVCLLVQCFLPRARFRANHYFSPVNVALALLHIKLLVVPVVLMTCGYENKIMALTASTRSIEGAILIDTIAYLAFCLGLQFAPSGPVKPGRFSLLPALSQTPSSAYVVAFAGLGLVGLFLTFGSIDRFIQYFSDPASIVDPQAGASWGEFFGTILRPFFAFSLVTWWSRVADRSQETGDTWRPVVTGLAAVVGITIANLTFGFNRGAVVFPLVSLIAVYSARIRRIPPVLTLAAVVCFVPVLMAVGSFRGKSQLAQVAPNASRDIEVSTSELTESILVYCGGPQLTAVFYESLDWGDRLWGGTTLVSSVMSPIPILGKGFRDTSGPVVYNHAIYGVSGIDDQIPAYVAELFGNFHVAGVVAGFVALSLLLAMFESWLQAVKSTFGAFIIQYIAVWGALLSVWSVSVYVQILFYFLGPVYLYLAATQAGKLFRRSSPPANSFQTGAGIR